MPSDIILIGPIRTGKSTLGSLLADKLQISQVPMDVLRFDYYNQIGYDEDLGRRLRTENIFELLRYWKPFEAYAVEKLLAEHTNCVIDFGAGHSVYDDPVLYQRVRKALEPYPNVVLVLPSPDLDESVRILQEREPLPSGEYDIHDYFVKHPCNHEFAKFKVYTKGKTPEEVRDEIIGLTQPVHF